MSINERQTLDKLGRSAFSDRDFYEGFQPPFSKENFYPLFWVIFHVKAAKEKAEILEINNTQVFIIGYQDLTKNKTSTNRLKDQADLEELAKRRLRRTKSKGL